MEDFVKMLKEVIEKLNDDIGNKRNMKKCFEKKKKIRNDIKIILII